MKILALEKEVPGVAEDRFTEEILKTEAGKAWELYQSGVIREMYFSADQHEAVLRIRDLRGCSRSNESGRTVEEC